jgi:Protein of unknown function (DUF3485)
MKRQKYLILVVALGMMAATGGFLAHYKSIQTLGKPGIKTKPIAGSPRMDIYLPELVLDYTSKEVPTDEGLLTYMPKDTSFAQRRYSAGDGFQTLLNVVLMGSDRTSIHKPEFCLRGSGWDIEGAKADTSTIKVTHPHEYELPISRLLVTRTETVQGHPVTYSGVYVYWFVADNDLTASHESRMWRMSVNLLKKGVLERWAYVACFSVCKPGEEEATFERMKKFIAASTPQFQLAAGPSVATAELSQTASK